MVCKDDNEVFKVAANRYRGTGYSTAKAGSARDRAGLGRRKESGDEGLAGTKWCYKRQGSSARAMLALREGDGKGGHAVYTLDRRKRVGKK